MTGSLDRWGDRVAVADWETIHAELDDCGCALSSAPCTIPGDVDHDPARTRAGLRNAGPTHRLKARLDGGHVRHGVSVIRSGQRLSLGLVFHHAG